MHTKTSQPNYSQSPCKINARKENAYIWRRLTGLYSIPADRSYWTLCNEQPPGEGSEIVQNLSMEIILEKRQFHGVDRDPLIIAKNELWHPEANWYAGDWLEVISHADNFNPSLIYLDTTSFADHRIASNLVAKTMMLCSRGTVLLANVMLNDPRSSRKFNREQLVKNLQRKLPPFEIEKWDSTVKNFDYSATGKTYMMTYVFYQP